MPKMAIPIPTSADQPESGSHQFGEWLRRRGKQTRSETGMLRAGSTPALVTRRALVDCGQTTAGVASGPQPIPFTSPFFPHLGGHYSVRLWTAIAHPQTGASEPGRGVRPRSTGHLLQPVGRVPVKRLRPS
jgi:hypothetical protein